MKGKLIDLKKISEKKSEIKNLTFTNQNRRKNETFEGKRKFRMGTVHPL